MADRRKPKPPADDEMVKVILIASMRWDGAYQPTGTVLQMTRAEAADYIALRFVQPEAVH
jgi:hypothetical protein